MLQRIRNSKFGKVFAVFLAINFLAEIFAPGVAFALTGGPSQPEVQSFEPVGTSEMVDIFSGDYNYNIPLMDVGGYPINISYHSGLTMDQEASWTGLGWNINAGAITRNMRGMPDDFNGDQVIKKFSMKPNRTYGAFANFGFETFGFENFGVSLSVGIGINYNNYVGVGFERTVNAGITAGEKGKGPNVAGLGLKAGADGLTLTPSITLAYSKKVNENESKDFSVGSVGVSFNSRTGLKNLNLNLSPSYTSRLYEGEGSSRKLSAASSSKDYSGVTDIVNGGGSISFGTQSYTPQVNMSMMNSSVTLSFKTGGTLFGLAGTANLGGYYSEQTLLTKKLTLPAYGYMNSESAVAHSNALMDFNREKDASFTLNTPALPVTNFTYDVYAVSGQGIGGVYRPFRSDLGYVYDNSSSTYSNSTSLGIELASGNLLKGGVDIGISDVTTTSGRWNSDNKAAALLTFRKSPSAPDYKPKYEPYYFKEAGEKSVDAEPDATNIFDNPSNIDIGGFDPVRVDLEYTGGLLIKGGSNFIRQTSPTTTSTAPIPTLNYRSSRQKRNQPITLMKKEEAAFFGLQPSIYNSNNQNSISASSKPHHIAEITTLRPDGSRYVFGLPAYNNKQLEVTFNASGNQPACSSGLISFTPGVHDSEYNRLGIDHYFSSVEMPAYAHSYLLTAVLSADYVDVTGNGPTNDDLGNYTTFNYQKSIPVYKWRVPVGANMANHNEGLKSNPADDQGNYIYGEKEIWYLKFIETKNYIAHFDLIDRKDGFGVSGSGGSIGSTPTKMIRKISLYTIPDVHPTTKLPTTASTPIKEVHFVYDYSLCPSLPNNIPSSLAPGTELANQGGKLTLKEIFFTYGKSNKARLSSYKFAYSTTNPSYNLKGYDRWGNYKPNVYTNCSALAPNISNAEFPYVEQKKSDADVRSSAWELNKVTLPSGGEINVSYESDDYAYVQDKPAMQMFTMQSIRGEGESWTDPTLSGNIENDLMGDHPVVGNEKGNNYLYFKLEDPIPNTTYTTPFSARPAFFEKYLKGVDLLYFRFLVNMRSTNPGNGGVFGQDYEYVSGYGEIEYGYDDSTTTETKDDYGVVSSSASPNAYDYGFVKIRNVCVGDKDVVNKPNCPQVNPISKAAWQFGRLHTPQLVWDQPNINSQSGIEQTITAIAQSSFAKNLFETIQGPNKTIRNKNYGKEVVLAKSWIRLFNPSKKKFGGGSRVKEIKIVDNWNQMTTPAQPASEYGQVYNYETTNAAGETISSGVAAYEPSVGGDENPFKQPVYFGDKQQNLLAPDDQHYLEEPFGESFFPSASVGYSKVTVKNLQYPSASNPGVTVKRHATGYVVHEFYTAYDFPTITKRTDLDVKPKKTSPILSLLKISMKDYMTASQGYVIELNDMHGKQKRQSVYAEDKSTPISGVRYFYKTDPNNSKRLNNDMITIDKGGNIGTKMVGVDYDFVADMRHQETDIVSTSMKLNVSTFIVGILPVLVPTIFPGFGIEQTRFRSAVTTKVINRYGLMVRTEAFDLGSKVSTNNLALDAETGEVLVTQTQNDFEDPIYSFSYPAHWGYDRMAQAYRNIGAKFKGVTFAGGSATVTNGDNVFVLGDEVSITSLVPSPPPPIKGWVCGVVNSSGLASINVIDRSGNPVPASGNTDHPLFTDGNYDIKIIRSGRRNQQTTSIGSVTSLKNPLDPDGNGLDGSLSIFKDVLNTNAVEFSDEWQMACGTKTPETTACQCTQANTTVDDALGSFFNNLASTGDIDNPAGVQVYNNPNYFHGYSSTLQSLHPGGLAATPQSWFGFVSGTTLNGFVAPCSDCLPRCSVTLTLASGSWSSVTALTNIQFVPPASGCPENVFAFTMTATISVGGVEQVKQVTGQSTCWPIATCETVPLTFTQCGKVPGDIVNPYLKGLRGSWRAKRSHLYLSDRSQTTAFNNNTDIRKDGVFVTYDIAQTGDSAIDFQPFWKKTSGNDWLKDPTYWTFTSEVTKFSPFGFELENRDALNRYSAAIYRYNNSLPIAVASNSIYKEIGYDGFEDYDFFGIGSCSGHFDFFPFKSSLSTQEAHTGLNSIKVPASSPALTMQRPLSTDVCNPMLPVNMRTIPPPVSPGVPVHCPFAINECDCIGIFSPETNATGKEFVLSYWVKESAAASVLDYIQASVNISIGNTPVVPSSVRKSELIDRWQRVEVRFLILSGSTGNLNISLANASATTDAYFDDIRIHPFNSNMKSFVYHPVNLRLMAELDENNYATFYEYDQEGALIRVKKETERGIVTIQESKNSSRKP